MTRPSKPSESPQAASHDAVRLRALIRRETRPLRPPLTPEFEIRGADEYAAIWSATEAELGAMGLPPPFWAFAWAGGQALARHLLDHPDLCKNRSVLSLGAGAGLEAMAAARAGAARTVANDVDPVALTAAELNAAANGLALETCAVDLLQRPEAGRLDPRQADLLLLGDALYETEAAAAFIALAREAAAAGADVLIGDAGRGFLPALPLERLAVHRTPTPVALEDRPFREASVYRLSR